MIMAAFQVITSTLTMKRHGKHVEEKTINLLLKTDRFSNERAGRSEKKSQ